MMNDSNRIDEYFQNSANALKQIQNEFDKYQNDHFVARPPEFFCLELNGEAGELANLEKKKWKGKDIDPFRLEDEAADVLIALMNYSNARGIDLAKAVINKLNTIEINKNKLKDEGKEY